MDTHEENIMSTVTRNDDKVLISADNRSDIESEVLRQSCESREKDALNKYHDVPRV